MRASDLLRLAHVSGQSPAAILDADAGAAFESLSILYQALDERGEEVSERIHSARAQGDEPGLNMLLFELREALIGG